MTTFRYPVSGGGGSVYWQDAVANFAALPGSGNIVGALRQALDTEKLYRWSGSAWVLYIDALGDVTGPAASVDGEIALFSGVTGKVIKRATGSGPARISSGVLGTGNTDLASEVTGVLPVANGGTNSSTALSSNRFVVSSGGKIVEASAVTASRAVASDTNGLPVASATTATQLGYLSTSTSDIQTQLGTKEPTITTLPIAKGGTNSGSALTNSKVMVSTGGAIVESAVTTTELGYISGVTGAIQTALDAKLPKAGGTMTGDIVLAGDATQALHPVTKQQFDAGLFGLDTKQPVIVATTANITLANTQTIDGVAVIVGDRVLVRAQSLPNLNGIYLVAVGAWTRTTDMDAWAEVPGSLVPVEAGGTTTGGTLWLCTAAATGTINVTNITFSQVSGPGTYTADGNGIEITGTQFSLELDGTTLSKSATGLKVAALGITNSEVAAAAAIAVTKLAAVTASKALASDGSGFITPSATTSTQLGYLSTSTSDVQVQLDAKLCAKTTVNVSSNVTLTDRAIHFVDTSSARSLTLPAPSTALFLVIKDSIGSGTTNNITLVRPGSQKIETVAASFLLDVSLGSWTIVSDGTDYFVI